MHKEISIDNGGTLTDIVVLDGTSIYTAKTLTTPFDLSQCFFDGLRRVSREIYGDEDIERLLNETVTIKYSTTQGTNALVERKGPRLGLIVSEGFDVESLKHKDENHRALFSSLVGDRVTSIRMDPKTPTPTETVVSAVNELAGRGASRILVCLTSSDFVTHERNVITQYENAFPTHLLGTVPVSASHEISGDKNDFRRIWTTILNGFLHPPMENFLFNAQKRLRNVRGGAAFRIFRNDGGSAKVSKTSAIKTYSSGPRGGMDAVRAAAMQRKFPHVISVDVGGTTSDLGCVDRNQVNSNLRGAVEGVETSIELCDIVSIGIGGGSIICAENDAIKVGPLSVGAAPGPACFGLGGTKATITDAFLALGVIEPTAFFGGGMALDKSRSEAAIEKEVGKPLGLSVHDAARAMVDQWVEDLAGGIRNYTSVRENTVLMAFGGAGPLSICEVAHVLGVRHILIPRYAAMFSAYGVSYSEVSQEYEVPLLQGSKDELQMAIDGLRERARRDMEAEGAKLDDCDLRVRAISAEKIQEIDLASRMDWPTDAGSLQMRVSAVRQRAVSSSPKYGIPSSQARADGHRIVRTDVEESQIPVYRLFACEEGAEAMGPAVLEGHYFTGYVPKGWKFRVIDGGDTLLERTES